MMDLIEVYARLRRECKAAGGQTAWATLHGLSAGYVSDVLNARKAPSQRVLAALNLVEVVRYVEKKPART